MAQDGPVRSQDGPTRPQDGPKWPQDGPSPNLQSILVPFWNYFGSKKHQTMKLRFKTIYDAVLEPILEPFWDQIWTYLGVLWDVC